MRSFIYFLFFIFLSVTSLAAKIDIDADEIVLDKNNNIIGKKNIKANYLEHQLQSEYIKYQKSQKQIFLKDNVQYYNKLDQYKIFADNIISDDEFNNITAKNSLLVSDSNNFWAKEIQKNLEEFIIKKGNYTSCNICSKTGKRKITEWQISSSKMQYAKNKKRIKFNNAVLKIFNIPVFYSPIFYYPNPELKKVSGLLIPNYQYHRILGHQITTPIFLNIASNQDITYKPTFFRENNLYNELEYRYLNKLGRLKLNYHFINENDNLQKFLQSKNINSRDDNNFKWILDFDELFKIKLANKDFYLESDVFLLSDKTILERYQNNYNVYLKSYSNLHYVSNKVLFNLAYSEINELNNKQNKLKELPNITWQRLGKTDNHFYYEYKLNAKSQDLGASKTRNKFTYNDNIFYKIDFKSGIRSEYGVENILRAYNNSSMAKQDYVNYVPTIYSSFYLPIMKYGKDFKQVMTPKISFIASPTNINSNNIANFDSSVTELLLANADNINKTSGYDVLEEGARINLSLLSKTKYKRIWMESFLAESYYFQDQDFDRVSGLKEKFSDILGYNKVSTEKNGFAFVYNWKMSSHDLSPYYNQFWFTFNFSKVTANISYAKHKFSSIVDGAEKIDYLTTNLIYKVKDNIKISTGLRTNLEDKDTRNKKGLVNQYIALNIVSKCLDYAIRVDKNNIQTEDGKNDLVIKFNIRFRTGF